MIQRCTNPNHISYLNYGGKGIQVCARWTSFEYFFKDMGERPPELTLDRFPNNEGNYEPGNCRWATWKEQGINRKNVKFFKINGESHTLIDWAKKYNIPISNLYKRVKNGMTVEAAIAFAIIAQTP